MTGTAHKSKPADTTMMGVVHDALRRDLHRLDTVLDAAPAIDPGRRGALSAHVEWMMQFLHRHHHGEDEGLWPLVRGRSAEGDALLDRMETDHADITPALEQVLHAASRYRTDPADQARAGLRDSLRTLSDVLLPHLRREEDEAMPLVAATFTNAEWNAWDHKHNVKGRSLTQLATVGHWLMDNLDPPRYQVLVHLVPPPARLLIVKGFARSYREACALRWGSDVPIAPL
jgi:hemerythrin-like domain-containing protein